MKNVGPVLPLSLLATAALTAGACKSASDGGEEPAQPGAQPGEVDQEGPSEQDADAFLQDAWRRLSLEQQKQVILVDQALTNARDLKGRLMLEEALDETERALQLDPDNLEAKTLRNEIGGLLGLPVHEGELLTQSLSEYRSVQIEQTLADAQAGLQKGQLHLAREQYDQAVGELTLVLDSIRWNPHKIEWGGLQEEVEETLERAKQERLAHADRKRADDRKEAYEQLQMEEQFSRERRRQEIDNILVKAIDAYNATRFDQAMDLAEEVLRKDPRNDKAQEIRDAAFRSGRVKVRADYVEAKQEEFRRWEEEIQANLIPQNDIVTLPDRDFWAAITELRERRPGIDLSQSVDPTSIALRSRLGKTRVDGLRLEEVESLRSVIDLVQLQTGLPLIVHELAEEAAIEEGAIFDLNLQNPITVADLLDLVTDMAGEEVTWTVEFETVIVTTREHARGQPLLVHHDIQDLIFGLTEFFGPRIDRIRLLSDIEDDDGGGQFGGIGERAVIIEEDDLATLVQENVSPASWDLDGVSIAAENGFLLITQSPEVQGQVRQFLEDLRRFNSSLVTIESKFMTIEDNWIQEIGVEFRGLDDAYLDDVTNGLEDMASLGLDNGGAGPIVNGAGPPGAGFFYDDGADGTFAGATNHVWGSALGSAVSTIGGMTAQWTLLDDSQVSMILRLVEKSQDIELINDQILSVHNTQRSYVTVINQQAYIQDFDVEVAQFEAVADPQINVLTEGVVLDVRPTIHYDRRYLTLEVQPTVAEVVALTDFSTTLGGQTSAVEFQLPELQVQSVFTTAVVPDGGSILLGGLSRIRNIERRAEVPWLANLPVLGFFFKEEGYSDEKSSLMIMLRAWITDVKEELAGY
jgi:tetratricopeptide (TPR) repeat protein